MEIFVDHLPGVTHAPCVHKELHELKDQSGIDTQDGHVRQLMRLTVLYKQFQRAELRLTQQIKSIKRTVDRSAGGQRVTGTNQGHAVVAAIASEPLALARDGLREHRRTAEKQLRARAEELHVWPWVKAIRGIGALGLGLIVGECGNLLKYAGPAKLWKRLGLAVIGGERQRRIAGRANLREGLTKRAAVALALEHGFSPRRRMMMHNVGDALLKLNKGEYRRVYDERKAYELARGIAKLHAHRRALRYMEKRFIVDLWIAWREATIH